MFSPTVCRSTSIVVAKRSNGQHCLVVSASTRAATEIVEIDLGTGLLAKDKEKYSDEASALSTLHKRGYEVHLRGCALIGYVAVGGTAGVLLATHVRKKCTLPGGHAVYLVVDSQWVLVQLQNGGVADTNAPTLDQSFWQTLQQYTLNNAHFFCETADLTRPFPSEHSPQDPQPEFMWNEWLREPLKSLGLQDACPILLQGAIECSQETHPTGERYSMALLSRRSRRHPGTRYLARGLNAKAGPGNEIECELILWTHPPQEEPEESLLWARLVWRRGTVPIWWGVNLQSLQKGLQAEVYVREQEPYKGTITYFRALQREHARDERIEAALEGDWALVDAGGGAAEGSRHSAPSPPDQGDGAGGGRRRERGDGRVAGVRRREGAGGWDPSLGVPVTCINLLHANPKKLPELMLSEHFHEAVRFVRKRLGGEAPIKVVNFDWHGNMGRLSEEKGIEGFWSFMDPVLRQCGMACGSMEPACDELAQQLGGMHSVPAAAPPDEGPTTNWAPQWRMRWRQQQRGVVRFNCADSLDRTNAATCFAMLAALQEGLRLLGIPLDCGGLGLQSPGAAVLARSRAPSRGATASGSAQDLPCLEARRADGEVGTLQQELPQGWDVVNHQGRALYVDHINKRTQWTPPVVQKPPKGGAGFMQSATDMFARLSRQSSPPRTSGEERPASRPSSRSASFSNLTTNASAASDGAAQKGGGTPEGSLQTTPSASAREGGGKPLEAVGQLRAPQEGHSRMPSGSHPTAHSCAALQPWAFFGLGGLQEVRDRLYRDAVADYVEMFKVHGDIHSFLYTGSPAMHSHVLGLVLQGGKTYGASSGVGKLQNLRVAVQRRWNNTMSDASRQQAMELFLGLNVSKYFRGLDLLYPVPPGVVCQLDPADLAPVEEELHKSTELSDLPLRTHDGLVGVQQDLSDLEPLYGEGTGGGAGAGGGGQGSSPQLAADGCSSTPAVGGLGGEGEGGAGAEADLLLLGEGLGGEGEVGGEQVPSGVSAPIVQVEEPCGGGRAVAAGQQMQDLLL